MSAALIKMGPLILFLRWFIMDYESSWLVSYKNHNKINDMFLCQCSLQEIQQLVHHWNLHRLLKIRNILEIMIFSIELLIQKGANFNEWCPDECALFVAENNCDAKLEKYSLLTMLISISKQPSVVTLLYSGLLLPIKKMSMCF